MLKEECRIRALAKLGYHMKKDINYVKTAIYQSLTDITFNKDSVDLIVSEVFGTASDIIDAEILSALGQLSTEDIDNEAIIEALNKLGQRATQTN